MKKNQYKLLINNQQKHLIKEAEFALEDTTKFLDDLVNTGTNLIKATVISLGAHWQHSVLTSQVVGFGSLENINKRFLEQINEANKLYNEAVPESVRNDVDLLFNMNNPAIFVGKKVINLAVNRETREMYIPFAWAIRYIFSDEFFKNDVKDFGKVLGGLSFNNIIWYKGWLYRKVIFNNIHYLEQAVNNGLLSKSGINYFKNLNNMNDVLKNYPKVVYVLRGIKAAETYFAPTLEFYDFCNRWNGEKFVRLMTLSYYISKKDESIRFQYGDTKENIKRKQADLRNAKTPEEKQKIQQEIDELETQSTEIENIKIKDPSDGSEFGIVDIVDEDAAIEADDIKTIGDTSNPRKTVIEQQIEDLETEIQTNNAQLKSNPKAADKSKELNQELSVLLQWREYLQKKYGNKYGDPADTSFIQAQQNGSNSIADVKKRKAKIKDRLTQLEDAIKKDKSLSLSENLKKEREILFQDFKEDFKNTAARVFKSETELIPNIVKIFTGDEIYDNLYKEIDSQSLETFQFLGQLIGANIPQDLKNKYQQATNLLNQFPGFPTGTIPNIPFPSLGGGNTITLTATVNSNTDISLNWTGTTNAVNIEYSESNPPAAGDPTYKSTIVSGTPKTISGLSPGTKYYFKVTDTVNSSDISNIATAQTTGVRTAPSTVPKPSIMWTTGFKITTKKFEITISNITAYHTNLSNYEFEITIKKNGFFYNTFVIPGTSVNASNGNIINTSIIPRGSLKIADKVEITCEVLDKTLATTSPPSNTLMHIVTAGRPQVKEYVLKISDNNKLLIENTLQLKSSVEFTDQMNDLKKMGLDSTPPSAAEQIVIKSALDDKKINKYTKQWIDASTLIKKSAGKLDQKKEAEIFLKMVKLSTNFFDQLQLDFMKGMENIRNEKSELNDKVNKDLKNSYGYELTPTGIMQKSHFNFQLLCYTYRIYSAAYLSNIQAIFEENDLVLKILNNVGIEELNTSLGKLKSIILPNIDSILNDDTVKKFEKVNDDLKQILGEETQTYADFKEQKDKLFQLIKDTKSQLKEFIIQIENLLNNIKQLPDKQKLKFLVEAITAYVDNNEKNVASIYSKFLPGLNKIQQTFKSMKDNALEMDKNYEALLKQDNDKIKFSKIYSDNFTKFEEAYSKCIKFTGLTADSPLNKIPQLKKLKEEYTKKLEESDTEQNTDSGDEEAVLSINDQEKKVTPITPIEMQDTEESED